MLIITVKSILVYRTSKVFNLQSKGRNFNTFSHNRQIYFHNHIIHTLKHGILCQTYKHTYNHTSNKRFKYMRGSGYYNDSYLPMVFIIQKNSIEYASEGF